MQQKIQGLNKEFEKRDVERMRNLIQGKANSSSENQICYKKKITDYKEGDIWTENKKKWTIKNGIKQTLSKLDAIKKEVFVSLCCPKCSKVIKSQLDKDNYKIHKKCHNCVVEFEHNLKINGEFNDYEKSLELKNNLSILDETEAYLLNMVNSSNSGFVSEDGVVERWVGGINKEKYHKEVKEAAKIRRKNFNDKFDE